MRRLVALLAVAAAACVSTAAAAAPGGGAVPILEYHVVGYRAAGAPNEGLYVTPADFRAQVAWLARNGWHAVTMDAVLDHWLRGAPLPAKPVALTFDDGYPGDWQDALPTLAARHWPGNLNLQVGNLVPKRVRQLIAAGWEIDVHTFTHPDLTTVSASQLTREVAGARSWIRSVFHVRADVFCYPAGRYDARVVVAVQHAGFRAAETENQGWASPGQGLETLDRLRVGPTTGTAGLAAYLRLTPR